MFCIDIFCLILLNFNEKLLNKVLLKILYIKKLVHNVQIEKKEAEQIERL